MGLVALIRRLIMTIITFTAPYYWYASFAPRLRANPNPPMTSGDVYAFAVFFLLPLLFSAFENTRKSDAGPLWGFVFGISLACGSCCGYQYFIGYPIWEFIAGIIFLSIIFGLGYGFGGMFVGSVFVGIWEWQKSAQLRAPAPATPKKFPALKQPPLSVVAAKKIICHKCDQSIPDTDSFCVYCGARIKSRIFADACSCTFLSQYTRYFCS